YSPYKIHAVFRLLVPLTPPLGHSFHLELGSREKAPSKGSRIRVELECICVREQLEEDMLCFLHHPKELLRRYQPASLLDTLCTGSYLDLVKTVHWFQTLVRSTWKTLPEQENYCLTVLPSSRSCKLLLISASGVTLDIEVILGVREDDWNIICSIE
ncbi:IPIL1 protein, partial [Bucorvus abyssinicus]|nr:IPIL1 protein [Bucorvus abyssinicus]